MSDDDLLELFEYTGVCRTLVKMLEYPDGVSKSFNRTFIKSSRTADNVMERLYSYGLIENTKSVKSKLTLSSKGRTIALKIRELLSLLRDE